MAFLKTVLSVLFFAVLLQFIPVYFHTKLEPILDGKVDAKFAKVKEVFRQNFADGWEEQGAAFAVYHKGKLVVDLWGGFADADAMRPWKKDTMAMAYSSTKAVAALCIAMLVDKGVIKYSDLVTKYWPEFGKHGKDKVTIAMLLNHQAGLAYTDEPITREAVLNHKVMSKIFENTKPNWPPGTANGYHALTFGWLVDQLVRRVDPLERSVGQFYRDEISLPFETDFHIGLPLELEYRVARQTYPSFAETLSSCWHNWHVAGLLYGISAAKADSPLGRVKTNPNWMFNGSRNGMNDPELHAMEIPAANGIGTARGLAKIFSILSSGKLIGEKTLKLISEPTVMDNDLVLLNRPVPKGLGFMHEKRLDFEKSGKWLIGHAGYGGQNVKLDTEHELAFAYVSNGLKVGMGNIVRTYLRLEEALYDSLNSG